MTDTDFENLDGAEGVSADDPYLVEPETDFESVGELNEADATQQVEYLREAIRFHDYRYDVRNDPIIADRAHDKLFDRLQTLEDEFDLQTENSPTQRVGGNPVDELGTVEHVVAMLSIDSSGDEDDVREFDERVRDEADDDVRYVCEPKFDGLSVEVIYEDGDPRRRQRRRRCHAERANHRECAGPTAGRLPRIPRGSRRGVHAQGRLSGLQQRTHPGERGAVREPSECGSGDTPTTRSVGDCRATARVFLASDGARYMTGANVPIDGGWTAH